MSKFKCPSGEQTMLVYKGVGDSVVAYATRKILEPTKYFLYMMVGENWKRICSKNSPIEFDKIIYTATKR